MSERVLQITRRGVSLIVLDFTIHEYETDYGTTRFFHYMREEENVFLENNDYCVNFFERFGLPQLKTQIVEAISQMIEDDRGDGSEQTKEIILQPKEKLKPHSSCKINQNLVSNVQATREAGVCQSELKQKLATIDKDSNVIETFEGNICSVCLSNYKEILDEDLHIVIPSCGHPFCCKCADNILDGEKKECPQCREKISTDSFNLMKFNADLKIETESQRLFL